VDKESREAETTTEWKFDKKTFELMMKKIRISTNSLPLRYKSYKPSIKFFYSFRPYPECYGVNAFTVDWHNIQFYAFPPFSCVARDNTKDLSGWSYRPIGGL